MDYLSVENLPSYDSRFRTIASVEDLWGRDPHGVNGMVPRSLALWMSHRPNIMQSAMFRSASNSCMTQSLSTRAQPLVLSIPFKHGFTLHWWTSAVQVMLEKTKGCAQVDKLWVIQLMEADLNMVLRIIFVHWLIHRAEDWGTIPLTQWGSQPNSCMTQSLSTCAQPLVFSSIICTAEVHQCRVKPCLMGMDKTVAYIGHRSGSPRAAL